MYLIWKPHKDKLFALNSHVRYFHSNPLNHALPYACDVSKLSTTYNNNMSRSKRTFLCLALKMEKAKWNGWKIYIKEHAHNTNNQTKVHPIFTH